LEDYTGKRIAEV